MNLVFRLVANEIDGERGVAEEQLALKDNSNNGIGTIRDDGNKREVYLC